MPRPVRRSAWLACLTSVAFTVASGCHATTGRHWQPLDANAFTAGRDVTVSSVLAGGGGQPWLAVGWRTDARGQQSPLGWSSPDGVRWSRDPSKSVTLDGPLDRLVGLARRGAVAVTAGLTQSATEGNFRPSMWHREPDGAWHEAPAFRELFGGERAGGLDAVATLTAGFLVAGGWTGPDGQFDVGVWTSVDGASWVRLDGDPALSPQPGESIRPIAATGGTSGTVIAGEADVGPRRQGLVWWSGDGRAWTRAVVDGSISLQQVVAVPGGFVVVGLRPDGTPAAWRSADGRGWLPAGSLPTRRGATVRITSAAADGTAVVVGGLAGDRAGLWRSAGGGRWQAIKLPAAEEAGPAISVVVAEAAGTILLAVDRPSLAALWRSS